ncbi:MAG: hypothetical protein JWP88_1571 [Flaviaesturariibacter sp.]|nr:hypothetical protein [Flaviaesturariibacter sp.]
MKKDKYRQKDPVIKITVVLAVITAVALLLLYLSR